MMDNNDIDNALHEIRQMIRVAINSTDSLMGSDADAAFFQMPRDDAEMLSFSLFDIDKRVDELKEALNPPTTSNVLTLVHDQV